MSKPTESWVSPYLTVADVTATVAFYREAFGFETVVVLDGPQGTPVHAEMRYRTARIMLGTHPDQTTGARPPRELGGTSVRLYITMDDVDAVVARAQALGAVVLEEPANQYWGDRTGSVRDPEGHVWWIATPIGA